MSEPQRFELSRREFRERFGHDPAPDVLGICFCGPDGQVAEEYVFTDEIMPFGSKAQIAELERMAK